MNWIFDSVPPAAASKRTQREPACPECCGEGFIEMIGGPGYFDEHSECWMPCTDIEPCAACRGTGVQEQDELADATIEPHHRTEDHVEVTEDAELALPF